MPPSRSIPAARQATAPLPRRYARSSGRWVTIGGKKGDGGTRHGGTPVYIENGRITKGAPSLTGKKIDALKEDGSDDPATHRQQLHREKGYRRAAFAKRARGEGVKPEHLHQLAAEMLAHDRAHKGELTKMLQWARREAKSLGSDLTTLKARAAHGIDSDAVRGLDDVAKSMATSFPEFFHGLDELDVEQRLFDLLEQGNPTPMSEEDAYEQALDHLASDKQGGYTPSDEPIPEGDEGPVPFGRRGRVARYAEPDRLHALRMHLASRGWLPSDAALRAALTEAERRLASVPRGRPAAPARYAGRMGREVREFRRFIEAGACGARVDATDAELAAAIRAAERIHPGAHTRLA